jgi:DNA-binding NarL/FixJ family response regulator
MEGGIYVPPELARQLAEKDDERCSSMESMSEPQRRILELLAQGAPNKAIAKNLGLASSTVKHQLTAIFQKLGVSNRTQAAMAARALVDEEEARRGGS